MSNDSRDEIVVKEKYGLAGHTSDWRTRRSTKIIIGTAVLFVIALSIGLSVGLGVGLNVRDSHKKTSSGSSSSSSSSTLPPLQSTPQSNFVLDGLKGQPPQTRFFNFTVSQVQGAPDGISKPMLVVNGSSFDPFTLISESYE